jgi:tetratricopeptide (TPR) repeat protein
MKIFRIILLIMLFGAFAVAAGCGGKENPEPENDTQAGFAHLERALAFIERGEMEKAMDDLVVAARLLPDNPEPFMAMGDVHMANRRFQEAVESFRAALAINQGIARAHFNIGYISKEFRDDLTTGLARLAKAAELDSTNATYAFQLGDVYHKMELFEEAKNSFERAISLDSDHAYAHYSLGEILEEHMDLPLEGFSEYEKAISIAPRDANLRLWVGKAYVKYDRLEEARRHLQEYLRLAPESPKAPAVEEMMRYLDSSLGVSR